MPIAAKKEMKEKQNKQSKSNPEVVIPKGYTVDEWLDLEDDYADESAIKEEEVSIRFER